MKRKIHGVLLPLLFLTIFSFSGCLVELETPPTKTVEPTMPATLRPSQTLTPSQTLSPSPSPSEAPTQTPTMTATSTPAPVRWTIEKGDELFAIALYYGISLDQLLAANPSVTPNWLSVGTVLEIPVTATPLPTNTATPTPTQTPTQTPTSDIQPTVSPTSSAPLEINGEPSCYLNPLGELNCLALLHNKGKANLENPSLSFKLSSKTSDYASELVVFAPLNIIPAGESLPVLATFPSPVPEDYEIQVEIDYWLPTLPEDERYAELEIVSEKLQISDKKLFAQVSGEIELKKDERDLASLWLLVTAFDEDGKPIGFRRWEANLPLQAAQNIPFNTFVYSLGPEIASVSLMAEARYQSNQAP